MAFQRPWMMRSVALIRWAFSFAKACSIGLKSGLQGGRSRSLASTLSTAARTAGALWLDRLFMMATSLRASSGTRKGDVGEERVGIHRSVEPHGATMSVRRSPAVKVVVFQ
ncbi:hypothetical protein ASE90_09465 [Sphingomonas sp. Leaf67]|nr:hypothetical protein ASE90_09465 [Sphingomonas sp. Leaf67]